MNHTLQITSQDSATLQAVSLPVDAGSIDILDRYVDSIVSGNRSLYDALEIHGVRNCEAAHIDNGTHYEIDNVNPTSFSVYAHIKGGGVDCVGDFSRYADAAQYGVELSGEYAWPIRNFVLEQHRMMTLVKLQ